MDEKQREFTGEIALDKQTFKLFRAWERFLIDRLSEQSPFMHAPLLIAKDELDKTGYIAHFPQNALRVIPEIDTGDKNKKYLTPASCLHAYPEFADTELKAPVRYTVLGRCARHEGGTYQKPYRLESFHMLEFVSIDTPSGITTSRNKAEEKVTKIFSELGIEVSLEAANDPFFAGEADGAYLLQKIKDLKHEYVVQINDTKVSLASINVHEQHFTEAYNIRINGSAASSLCVAFGLERIVMYSISLWGPQEENWPQSLQAYV